MKVMRNFSLRVGMETKDSMFQFDLNSTKKNFYTTHYFIYLLIINKSLINKTKIASFH